MGERILIVDDEPDITRLCTRMLRGQNYTVQGSTSGREAIRLLESEPFDLLVVDVKMPDVDGLTVLRKARELQPNIAAVVITGFTTLDNAIQALRAGAHGFVLKPFGVQEFGQAVGEALAQRQKEQERLLLRAQLPILEVAQALMSQVDLGSLSQQLLKAVARELEADLALLLLLEEASGQLYIADAVGLPGRIQDLAISRELTQELLQFEEPLDLEEQRGIILSWQEMIHPPEAPILYVPLRTARNAIGALYLCRQAGGSPFTQSARNLISVVAQQIATALENARLFEIVARGKREWETTFDAISDGILICDENCQVIRANREMAARLHTTPEALVNRSCPQLIFDQDGPQESCPCWQVKGTLQPHSDELEMPILGGTFSLAVYPVQEETGQISHLVHVFRDITERKQATEALRRERDLVTRIMETSPVGITLVDRQGRITFANTYAQRLLGLSRNNLPQRTYNAPEWRITDYEGNPFPDEDMPFSRVMATGQPVQDVRHTIEQDNGLRIFLSINAAPLFDDAGQVDGMVAAIEDVTEKVRAEEALRESEEKFRNIIESIPMGMHMYELTPDGQLVFTGANPAAEKILGVDHRQFIGKTIEQAFPSSAGTEVPEQYHRVAAERELWRTRQISYADDRIAGIYEVHAFPTTPGRMVAAFLEVTERERAEQALRRSEATLRSIFRAASVGIGLVSDRKFLWTNDCLHDMVGYTAKELAGQSARILYPDQEEFERVGRVKYAEILTKGSGTIETRFQHKDGTIIDVLLSSTAIDPADLTAGVIFTALDITKRKRAVEALAESEARYRAVVEDQTEFIVRWRPDGTRTFVNEAYCRYFGQSRDELLGTDFLPFELGRDREAVRDKIAHLTPDSPTETNVFQITRKDGRIAWHEWTDRAIFDPQGHVIELQSVGRDITERMQAEQEIKRRNQELSALNTIATAISQSLDLEHILYTTLDQTLDITEMDGGWIQLLDQDRTSISVEAQRGLSPGMLQVLEKEALGQGLVGQVIEQEQTVIITDLSADSQPDIAGHRKEGLQALTAVPISSKEKTLGVLGIFSRSSRPVTAREEQTLTAIGHQIGVAVENVRLFEQLFSTHKRLRQLAQKIVSVQEEERRRLSRELHDEAGQALTALRIGLQLVQSDLPAEFEALSQGIGEAIALTERTMKQIRVLAQDLRPPALDAVGLNPTLEGFCRDFAERTQLKVTYTGTELPPLPDDISICLYRFLQETLTNVVKHAQASAAQISLDYDGETIKLDVQDNGQGFPEDWSASEQTAGLGLLGIQERLDLLDGWLEIVSHPSQGSRLIAYVPWEGAP